MRSFNSWLHNPGFWVRQPYDARKKKLVKEPGRLKLFDWQSKLTGYLFTVDLKTGRFPYDTVILSTLKKTGKTALLGALLAWYFEEAPAGTEVYSLANDIEQAEGRAFKVAKYGLERRGYATTKEVIRGSSEFGNDSSFIQILSSHYTSAAGAGQSFTCWDELWGFTSEKSFRLWDEMTLIPTEQLGMRVITTYAGFEGESELLWDLYEKTVINGEKRDDFGELPCYTNDEASIFTLWDHKPRMPWQTSTYYAKEAAVLRPSTFLRFHRNQWATSEDSFIDIQLWDDATTIEASILYDPQSNYRYAPIVAYVDVGAKRDSSAVVGIYFDADKGEAGLAFHRIWTPPGNDEFLHLESTVEDYILQVHEECNLTAVYYDPTQFVRSMQTLQEKGVNMVEHKQSGQGAIAISTALYEGLRSGKFRVYEDSELRDHIRFARAKNTKQGFQIIKNPDANLPNDGAIATAGAYFFALKHKGSMGEEEQVIRSQFADESGYKPESAHGDQSFLPEPLRDDI